MKWKDIWEELPREEDGTRFPAAFYGEILKGRGQEALKVEAKLLSEELKLWLRTMLD